MHSPAVKEETLHLHVVVRDKHVPLHPDLQDGRWTDRSDHRHQEVLVTHQFHRPRDIHKLCVFVCLCVNMTSSND